MVLDSIATGKNKFKTGLLSKMILAVVIILISTIGSLSVFAQPIPGEFESNDVLFWNPNDCVPEGPNGTPGAPAVGNPGNIVQGGWTKVGVSVYGNWGDDNGQGALGPHRGQTMFAELSSPGTLDFKRLADVLNAPANERGWPGGSNGYKPGSKFALSYTPNGQLPDQGNIIIMDKRDVGGGQGTPMIDGAPRSVDLWWQAAQLIGWTDYGLTAMWIKKVPDETPVTPIGGGQAPAVPGGTAPGDGSADGEAGYHCVAPGGQPGFGNGGPVDGDYAFPVLLPKSMIYNWYRWPCPGICHHDGTGAMDITERPANDEATGTPVLAITNGTLASVRSSYMGQGGCNSVQLLGDDGFYYWYGHIQQSLGQGTRVTVGQQIAVIGQRRCTGNGSAPHLHIDRGWPMGQRGGSVGSRDPGFPQLINRLYAGLPDTNA